MKPLKLKMQAFGSYGEETLIDFEKVNQNLFLITGDTGAGKTTIFDAIVFALYGEASSSANKKEGVVLQSQYVDFAKEPFVELTFSEGNNADSEIYTVRRVPRHLKPITRGTGKGGQREITGSVSLIMPDGMEYPSKEADSKLREIVGLTKSQFMQVAMIAQGEFMDLLRAKSDDKKVIFRKLFNTEMYQDIVTELGNRKREKDKEIAILKTQCQTEAVRIRIPETYELQKEMQQSRRQIEEGQTAGLADFMDRLGVLCNWMKKELEVAEGAYKEVECARTSKGEELAKAEELLKWFVQFEKAAEELQRYEAQEPEMIRAKELAGQIRAVYEIAEKYNQYHEAETTWTDSVRVLKEWEEKIPKLLETLKATQTTEKTEHQKYNQEIERYSIISEKVRKSREILNAIRQKEREITADKRAAENAEKDFAEAETALENQEKQEAEWKKESDKLADTDKMLAGWDAGSQEAESLRQELDAVSDIRDQAGESLAKAKKKLEIYAKTSKEYQKHKDSYEKMRQMFLNEQAGMLAADLKPGIPCPVCGSTDHPHPFAGAVDHVDISPEKLQKMAEDVENLRTKQEQAANESHAAKTRYETRKENFVEAVGRLRNRMQKSIPEIQKDAGLSEMNEALKIWKNAIDRSLKTLKKDAEKLGKIRELLQNADDQRGKLKEKLELCRTAQTEAARKLTEDTAQLNSFRTSCEFASEKEASDTLEKAEIAKQASEKIYKRAADALDAASSAKQNAETLIAKYQKEIPAQEENFAVKKAAYMDFMQEKQMTEEAWKQLAKENSRDDEKELTDTVNAYREAKAAAIAQKKAANEAIGEAQKPDLDKIKAEKEETETVYQMAEKKYNQLKMDCKNNQEIFTALSARMEKRKAVVEEHARIDALYRMTSGNVSGSRMDLETFVQRYYLERILYAANRRFQEMSAGQFELRMYDLKKAGEGKNRGLDLMVYSTVTGKEREVRTLSGGESFMAALSLALGMADQIKQSSAAINLDMMFIDEGFGSLDEHSRNQAVRVLQEMAEGSRLIGIISHVSELKQEIEDQLIVTKDENGSHVKWQIS